MFALLSAVFAALVAIFAKLGLSGIDTTLATSVRAVVMAIFLVGASLALGKFSLLESIAGKPFYYIIASGIAGALSWLFYFFALKYGPTSGVAALDRLSVVFVFIFAVMILHETLTWKALAGVIFIIIGAMFMVL